MRSSRDKLAYLCRGAEFVVFSGSLPRGVDDDFYVEAIREANRRGVPTVLDSEGEPLRRGVEAEPYLVTPNVREAEQLVGHEFGGDDDLVAALDEIVELGARNVLITTRGRVRCALPGGPHRAAARRHRAAARADLEGRLRRRAARRLPRRPQLREGHRRGGAGRGRDRRRVRARGGRRPLRRSRGQPAHRARRREAPRAGRRRLASGRPLGVVGAGW